MNPNFSYEFLVTNSRYTSRKKPLTNFLNKWLTWLLKNNSVPYINFWIIICCSPFRTFSANARIHLTLPNIHLLSYSLKRQLQINDCFDWTNLIGCRHFLSLKYVSSGNNSFYIFSVAPMPWFKLWISNSRRVRILRISITE